MLKVFKTFISVVIGMMGLLIHLWTVGMSFDMHGVVASIFTFILPIVSTIFYGAIIFHEQGLTNYVIAIMVVYMTSLVWELITNEEIRDKFGK